MKYLKWLLLFLLLLPPAVLPLYFLPRPRPSPDSSASSGWSFLPFLWLGLVFLCVLLVFFTRSRWTGKELALANAWIKLIHLPIHMFWFNMGLLTHFFVWRLLAFFMGGAIALSGLVGLAAVLRCRAEGRFTTGVAVINGILQFVFFADVLSAFWVFDKSE